MKETSNYRKYTSTNPVQKFLMNNFRQTLFQCLKELGTDNVLDAGCGEGFILSELKRNNIGKYLEGIDYSQEALDIGNKLFPDLVLKQGNIYSLPYQDNSFDLVICTEVLEHLEKPEKILDEIERVSRKYCLFSVPNEPYFKIGNLIRGKNIWRLGNDIDHVQNWSSKAFQDFIKTKFKILTLKKPFPWTMVLCETAK